MRWSGFLALFLALGCELPPESRRRSMAVEVTAEGIAFEGQGGEALLLPTVLIDGEWRGAGRDGACRVEGARLICPVSGLGDVAAEYGDGLLQVGFIAGSSRVVEGLALEGTATIEGADSWLSNGFQSWSQSGIVALAPAPDPSALAEALADTGDSETMRGGAELSNWYTFVGGGEGDAALVVGAVTADRFRPWVLASREAEEVGPDSPIELRIVSGGAGEAVPVVAGEGLGGEPFFFRIGNDLTAMLREYGEALPSRGATNAAAPELGWNSWYDLWDGVDEAAVRANANLAQSIFADAPWVEDHRLRIVVDDGWQVAWGEWEANDKFPSGMAGLAADLHAQGFETGIWLAPLLVHEESLLVAEHPEWFLPDIDYHHLANGRMRILDVTNPGAANQLSAVISTIVGWGYDLLKIDFLFAGAWESPRHVAATGMEAYNRALQIIRGAAGDETILLAVGAPPLPSLPYADAWRLGADIALEPFGPSWFFAVNQARSIAARWPICLALYCDADPPLLRDLPIEEVEFGAWVVALAGGGVFLSDDLRHVAEDRYPQGADPRRLEVSLSGEPSVPLDHFPGNTPATLNTHIMDYLAGATSHVLPSRWRTPDGSEILFNFTEEAIEVDGGRIPARSARELR